MKIYRYPKTNYDLITLTDKKNLSESNEDLKSQLDFDITIDKSGERHSRISIEIESCDYRKIVNSIISEMEIRVKQLDNKINQLRTELRQHSFYWYKVEQLTSSQQLYNSQETLEIIRHISENLAIGHSEGINSKFKISNEINKSTLTEFFQLKRQSSASKCWKILKNTSNILSLEVVINIFQLSNDLDSITLISDMKFYDYVIKNFDSLIDNSKLLKVILLPVDKEKTTFLPSDILDLIFYYMYQEYTNYKH